MQGIHFNCICLGKVDLRWNANNALDYHFQLDIKYVEVKVLKSWYNTKPSNNH